MNASTSFHCKKFMILYGSETGTAQKLSELIWRDARCRKIPCQVLSMDDYNIEVNIL